MFRCINISDFNQQVVLGLRLSNCLFTLNFSCTSVSNIPKIGNTLLTVLSVCSGASTVAIDNKIEQAMVS